MTKTAFKLLGILATLLLSASCYRHSMPQTNSFIGDESQSVPTAQVFVDANGTYYPSNWKTHLGPNRLKWKRASLLNVSSRKLDSNPDFRKLIEADEKRQLHDIATFAVNKKRIFIFIHGYNNDVDKAGKAYKALESKIALTTDDGVIRFYWDGLRGPLLGGLPIWFPAAGNSQLAGARGLRRMLDQMCGKTIYLIGHSRGLSVMLSALGNPVYDPEYLKKTRELIEDKWGHPYDTKEAAKAFLSPAPLRENGNCIHILVMAPAVDLIDFWDESEQNRYDAKCVTRVFRDLGTQLKTLRYTVNTCDCTLNKFFGVGRYFNPTGLGSRPKVGEDLSKERKYLNLLKSYRLAEPMGAHGWLKYIERRETSQMLEDAGIKR